jgi:hypothetical protein
MKTFNPNRSHKIDWTITRMEATRGWRRMLWRFVKAYHELWI